jgi:hypothetical protein
VVVEVVGFPLRPRPSGRARYHAHCRALLQHVFLLASRPVTVSVEGRPLGGEHRGAVRLLCPGRPHFCGFGLAPRRRGGVVKTGAMRKQKPPVLDGEKTARAVAAMALGRAAAHRERLAAQAKLLAEYTAMDLEELHWRGAQDHASCAVQRMQTGRRSDLCARHTLMSLWPADGSNLGAPGCDQPWSAQPLAPLLPP